MVIDEYAQYAPTGPHSAGLMLTFAGGLVGAVGTITKFVGDGILTSTEDTALQYPITTPRKAQNFAVFVRTNTLSSSSTITVYKNGATTGVLVTVGAGATGLFTSVGTAEFAAGDTIDVGITNGGALGLAILFSATVELV